MLNSARQWAGIPGRNTSPTAPMFEQTPPPILSPKELPPSPVDLDELPLDPHLPRLEEVRGKFDVSFFSSFSLLLLLVYLASQLFPRLQRTGTTFASKKSLSSSCESNSTLPVLPPPGPPMLPSSPSATIPRPPPAATFPLTSSPPPRPPLSPRTATTTTPSTPPPPPLTTLLRSRRSRASPQETRP